MVKEDNLHKWNLIHKILWLQLIKAKYVKKNDSKTFYIFATILSKHLEKDNLPTFDEIYKEIKINHT